MKGVENCKINRVPKGTLVIHFLDTLLPHATSISFSHKHSITDRQTDRQMTDNIIMPIDDHTAAVQSANKSKL